MSAVGTLFTAHPGEGLGSQRSCRAHTLLALEARQRAHLLFALLSLMSSGGVHFQNSNFRENLVSNGWRRGKRPYRLFLCIGLRHAERRWPSSTS